MNADFLPIKTYVDYGLDKDPKEEYKTDPITQILEVMGSLGKGEHMWYQVLIQDESVYSGKKMPKLYVNEQSHKHMSLKDMADEKKKQIKNAGYIKKGDVVYDSEGNKKTKNVQTGEVNGKPIMEERDIKYGFKEGEGDIRALTKDEIKLTQEDKDTLETINKKIGKPLAATAIRIVYVALLDLGSRFGVSLSGFGFCGGLGNLGHLDHRSCFGSRPAAECGERPLLHRNIICARAKSRVFCAAHNNRAQPVHGSAHDADRHRTVNQLKQCRFVSDS